MAAPQQEELPGRPAGGPAGPADGAAPENGEVERKWQIDKFVLAYLRNRGYREASQTLQNEAEARHAKPLGEVVFDRRLEQGVYSQIAHFSATQTAPEAYEDGYSRLRRWAESSLDIYRMELVSVLWPVFVYSFLDLVKKRLVAAAHDFLDRHRKDHEANFAAELLALQGVLLPEDLTQHDVPRLFLQQKVEVSLSAVSHQLLFSFLMESNLTSILALINEHMTFNIVSERPLTAEEVERSVRGHAVAQQSAAGPDSSFSGSINRSVISWGLLGDVAAAYNTVHKEQMDSLVLEAKKRAAEEVRRRFSSRKRSGSQEDAASEDRLNKKDKLRLAHEIRDAESAAEDAVLASDAAKVRAPSHVSESRIPLPPRDEAAHLKLLEDMRAMVPLSNSALPSVCFYTFLNSSNLVNSASLSADGSLVAAALSDSTVRLWDLTDSRCVRRGRRPQGVEGESPGLAVEREPWDASMPDIDLSENRGPSSGGGSGGGGGASAPSEDAHVKLVGHSGPVYRTSFSPDGQFVLSCSEDTTVRLWHRSSRRNLVCYQGHAFPVWDVDFSPVGFYFATASHDCTARLWSTDKISPLRVFGGHLSDVECVRFHPNVNYVATGSADKSVRLWDVQSGECVRLFTGHNDSVLSLALSPDGRYAASGGADHKVLLWDLSTGTRIQEFRGHRSSVTSLDFSAEGTLLASGSLDNSIRLWRVKESPSPQTASKGVQAQGRSSALKSGLIKTLWTKRTNVLHVRFTPRNLLLGTGVYSPL